MPIISVRYNGNNGWKRNAKTTTTKTEKNKGVGGGGTEKLVKGGELNDFVGHLG